jgi:enolase-phosphatase E1
MEASRESASPVRAILLDIEGTTTSIDFVYQTLFPYFRQHLEEFLTGHKKDIGVVSEVKALLEDYAADINKHGQLEIVLRKQDGPDADSDSSFILAYVNWLMDRDRKSRALKSLQGKVWEGGYRKGELSGHVYPDVPPAFRRWRETGVAITIFSSGSVLAQRLLFAQTVKGDLSSYIHQYFDTTTGPKGDSRSYATISEELKLPPASILFISDTVSELDAARLAGMNTRLCARSGPPAEGHGHAVIVSFDEVLA